MLEKYIDRFCRICMNESHSYSPIYEIYSNNSMLFEVINDVCDLEVTIGDELPRYICRDCSFKLSEWRKFKIRSHEVRASLQLLKENLQNLYLNIPSKSSLTENREYIKVDVETQDSYDYASGRVESSEQYIGIEPDDFNLSTVDMEKCDIKTAIPDLNLNSVDVENHDVKTATPDPLDLNLNSVDVENHDVKTAAPDPLDLNLNSVDVENHDVKTATPDPLDVDTESEVGELCFDEDVNDGAFDEEEELDLKESYLPSHTTDGGASQVTNQAHEEIMIYELKVVKGKELFGMELLSGNIQGRKTIDDPEEGTIFDAKRPIPCSNSKCVNFAGIRNPSLEMVTNGKFECNACRENSTSNTDTDKPEVHRSGGEKSSNLSQFEINEDGDNIRKMFRIHGMPIAGSNKSGIEKQTSKSGDLRKEKIFSNGGDLNEGNKFSESGDLKVKTGKGFSKGADNVTNATEDRKRFCCDVCGKRYRRKLCLGEHVTTHTGERNFQCPICKKCFACRRGVANHSLVHDKSLLICCVCTVCGKGFKRRNSLFVHMRTHDSERKFNCDICGKRYTQKFGLIGHLRTHTGERPFLCSICGKGYSQADSLKRHMILHSGIRPFGCEICGMKFALKKNLKTHMMRHGDERPFSCDQCDKTFKLREDLQVHLKVHKGLKCFKCCMCGKAFQKRNNLKAHLRCHTGEKPFPCPNCGKCFSQSSSMNRHLKGSCGGKMSGK